MECALVEVSHELLRYAPLYPCSCHDPSMCASGSAVVVQAPYERHPQGSSAKPPSLDYHARDLACRGASVPSGDLLLLETGMPRLDHWSRVWESEGQGSAVGLWAETGDETG